jgi:hypothetical protein
MGNSLYIMQQSSDGCDMAGAASFERALDMTQDERKWMIDVHCERSE